MKFAQEAVLKKQQEIDTKRNTKPRDRKSKGKEDYNDINMSDLSDSHITEIEKRN